MHISPYLSVFNWCSASKGFDSGKPFTGGGVGWGGLGRAGAEERSSRSGSMHLFALDGWVVESVGPPVQQVISGLRRPVLWDWWAKPCVPTPWPWRDGGIITCLADGTAGFWRTDTSLLGWIFRFCLLLLPISKYLKEMSGAGVPLNFMLWSLSLPLETLIFWTLLTFNQIWPDSVPLIPYYARISDIKDIGEVIKSNFLKTTHVP